MRTVLLHSLWASTLLFLLSKLDISTVSLHGITQVGMNSQSSLNWSEEARSQQQISYLQAKEFEFDIWIEDLSKSSSKFKGANDIVRHDSDGFLDMMLIPQEGGLKVVLQISRNSGEPCKSQPDQACQQGGAAPARGNVAEIQWSLPTRHLKAGTYSLGKGGSTPQTEVITFWRNLASALPDRHTDCQRWGEATLNIQRADVKANGTLSLLEGTLTRVCEQSWSEPPLTHMKQPGHKTTLSTGRFTLHANWWTRLTESPR